MNKPRDNLLDNGLNNKLPAKSSASVYLKSAKIVSVVPQPGLTGGAFRCYTRTSSFQETSRHQDNFREHNTHYGESM